MEKTSKKKSSKSSKKRKADTSGDAPPVKKSKKSSKKALNETEEEWQKYVKLQKASGTGVKKKSDTPNAGVKKASKQEKKKKKKTNPLLKQREPCDLMCNKERSDALAQELKEAEENNAQKALAINVMPERSRQTAETLTLGIEAMDVMPIVYNEVDFGMAIKRMNYERTAEHAYPLQDLMGDHGFFSINNEHVEHVLKCIIKDKRTDIAYAKSEGARNPATKKKGGPNLVQGDTSNKKLNQVCGNNFQSFGYNRRTPQIQHNKMKAQDAIDRLERFKEFFKNDELDEDETHYGDVPENYKMFRKLRRAKGDKFNRRTEQLRLCAALTPKADIEEVSKEQILDARQPPGTGDALCSYGTKCIFNNFSPDKTARYIGRVFYSEREKAKRLKRQVDGCLEEDEENEEDEEWESHNVHRLCIDCLFKRWTIQWAMNIRNEVIPERQINYFTVQCKPGQYSPHCMLSMVENNKLTGIVGHVPRFSLNNRRIVTHQRHRRTDNKYETVSVPVLVETGMDF